MAHPELAAKIEGLMPAPTGDPARLAEARFVEHYAADFRRRPTGPADNTAAAPTVPRPAAPAQSVSSNSVTSWIGR